MNDENTDLRQFTEAVESLDSRLHSALGRCLLLGTEVHIDSGLHSIRAQEAVLEHELVHRGQIRTSHFGNLYTVVGMSLHAVNDFRKPLRVQIRGIANSFSLSRFVEAMEGSAMFHERRLFHEVGERDWLSALASLPIQAYHDGYLCASRIMNHFSVDRNIIPSLADAILGLAFCVDWYEPFTSVDSAYRFLRSIDESRYPSARLRELANSLDAVAAHSKPAIQSFCSSISKDFQSISANVAKDSVEEETCVGFGSVVMTKTPVGTELTSAVRRRINEHLRTPLASHGFVFADPSGVPDINRLVVRAWNQQALPGRQPLAEFATQTTFGHRFMSICSKPIDKHRAIDPATAQTLGALDHVLQRSAEAYCVARLHQVWEEEGWSCTKSLRLPKGAWYVVVAVLNEDLFGETKQHVTSPEFEGDVRWHQFYRCFGTAAELIQVTNFCLPRTLWLLPAPDEPEYRRDPPLVEAIRTITDEAGLHVASTSDFYRVLSHNSLEDLLARFTGSRTEPLFYFDDPNLPWRLWRSSGRIKEAFVTPAAGGFSEMFEQLVASAGISCRVSASRHDPYLIQWLGSGEGY